MTDSETYEVLWHAGGEKSDWEEFFSGPYKEAVACFQDNLKKLHGPGGLKLMQGTQTLRLAVYNPKTGKVCE